MVGQPAGAAAAAAAAGKDPGPDPGPAAPAGAAAVERTELQEDLESITEVDEDNLTHSASDASVSVSEIDNKHKGMLKT